ncbi:MAG: hypothetical protein GY730_10075 [bacterium]|nr:hypothetical protein [bacterium]
MRLTVFAREIFSGVFNIIKKDKIILAPSFIFFSSLYFLVALFPQFFDYTADKQMDYDTVRQMFFSFFFVSTLNTLLKGITISMSVMLYEQKILSGRKMLLSFIKKIPHLLISSMLFLIPLYFMMKFVLLEGGSKSNNNAVVIFSALILIPLVLIYEFVPVMIIGSGRDWFNAILSATAFVKANIKKVLIFKSLSICVIYASVILTSLFYSIPLLGKTFFQIIILGGGYCFTYIMTVVFYYQVKDKNGVSVLIDSLPKDK